MSVWHDVNVSFVFFFKQKTAYEMRISDWSSDVCSSDLLATMSAALPAREPVARRVPPTGAELLESRHEWLRPSYFACVDSAGSVEAQEACVDEEFAYQDGELNRIYREKLATLSRRDQNRSEEHTSELQSLMRNSYAVFC